MEHLFHEFILGADVHHLERVAGVGRRAAFARLRFSPLQRLFVGPQCLAAALLWPLGLLRELGDW